MSKQLYDTAYSILALGGVMSTMRMEKLVYYTNIECVTCSRRLTPDGV